MADLDLPTIELPELSSPRRAAAVETLGRSLEQYGFFAVRQHGIDVDLLRRAYDVAARFFELPEHVKQRHERPSIGRQRGYTGFGIEHAKNNEVADLKEFYQVGRFLDADHPLIVSGGMPTNQHPAQPEDFGRTFDTLFTAMDDLGRVLLSAISEHLGLAPDTFASAVHDGNSVLRVIHYPPVAADAPREAIRAAAHEDINLLTILPASTQPGLELQDRATGDWRAVVTPPDVMICDTGDIMALFTNGRLPATTHRVVNPPGSGNVSRFSMPYFMHPRPDWLIRPLDGDAAPITAGHFLRQRLIENGVLKA
jgi:isopenicillin N synthase-like dioxygenase